MQILLLSDKFPPAAVTALASRTFENGREWMRAGHEWAVITWAQLPVRDSLGELPQQALAYRKYGENPRDPWLVVRRGQRGAPE